MFWNVYLVTLLLFSSVIDFYAGNRAWKTQNRIWVIISVIVNFGVLGFFKYTNFFFEKMC